MNVFWHYPLNNCILKFIIVCTCITKAMYYYVNICPLRVPLYGNKRYSFIHSFINDRKHDLGTGFPGSTQLTIIRHHLYGSMTMASLKYIWIHFCITFCWFMPSIIKQCQKQRKKTLISKNIFRFLSLKQQQL